LAEIRRVISCDEGLCKPRALLRDEPRSHQQEASTYADGAFQLTAYGP